MRWRCLSLACILEQPRRYEWLYPIPKCERTGIGLYARQDVFPLIPLHHIFCRDGQINRDIDLKIPRGAQSGTRVVIPGIIDPGIANVMPGDLVFILKVTFEAPPPASHFSNSKS